jgi:hypothetical protein
MVNHQILWIDARILDFFIKGCINKDNQINLLIKNLYSKGLERSIRYVGVQTKGHYFIFQ